MSSEQITVTVVGPSTNATITSGTQINVTLGDVGPINWSEVAGKPTTFPPQAHSHAISDVTGLTAALAQKVELDPYGKVLASQLPSYVDDVLEFANLAALPATGETGKIYVTTGNGKIYRWSGSTYIEISAAPGSTDFVPEGTGNLYHTTARAAAAAPVQSVAGQTGAVTLAKADVGLGNVDNTADASKPVSTAQAAADAAVASAAAADATSKANAAQAAAVQRANHTGTQLASTISDFAAAVVAAAPPTTDASLLTSGTLAAARIGSHASSHQTGGADAINPVIVTPASLSASQNDYAPGTADIIRLSSSTAVDITGLLSPSVDGALRLIINTNASGGAAITLRHESTSSAAANRFRNTTGGDYILPADGGSAVLTYSSAISRWRIL